jgi:hypothetical protein
MVVMMSAEGNSRELSMAIQPAESSERKQDEMDE